MQKTTLGPIPEHADHNKNRKIRLSCRESNPGPLRSTGLVCARQTLSFSSTSTFSIVLKRKNPIHYTYSIFHPYFLFKRQIFAGIKFD